MTRDLLGAILTAHPRCRECNKPGFWLIGNSHFCDTHMVESSGIATGKASSGEKVTAPAALPSKHEPGSFTDSHTNTFRVAANREIQVVSSDA